MAAPIKSNSGILADLPTDTDALGFAPYANTLRDLILDKNTRTPLTIGLFGTWGSGKTSLMKMVENGLLAAAKNEDDVRAIYPIWFNAWLYTKEKSLWRALIMQVLSHIRKHKKDDKLAQIQLDILTQQLYRAVGPSELGSLSITAADLVRDPGSAEITLGLQQGIDLLVDLAGVRQPAGDGTGVNEQTEEQPEVEASLAPAALFDEKVRQATAVLEQQRIESLELFQETFHRLVKDHINGFLVIFVDDLDRCLPEKAVEILEAIKLFLDAPGCVFILGIDREVVERGIRLRYGEMGGRGNGGNLPLLLRSEDLGLDPAKYRAFMQGLSNTDDVIDGGRYLEKIIQVPVTLPPIKPEAMGRFIAGLQVSLPDPECGRVFSLGLEPNPRQVKRALNIFTLLWNLYQNRQHELTIPLEPVRLAKLVVIQQRYEQLYRLLRDEPGRLIAWESWFRQAETFRESWESFKTPLSWGRLIRESEFGNLRSEAEEAAPFLTGQFEELMRAYEPLQPELAVVPIDEWPALSDFLMMHELNFEQYNFADLSESELESYVFLTRTVREAVTPTTTAPDDIEVEEVYLASEPIVLESRLDPSTAGYVSANAYGVLEKLRQEEAYRTPSRENYEKITALLADQGREIFQQLRRGTDLPPELLEQEQALVHIPAGQVEWQIPWELVYDQGPELSMEGFWGWRHVIQRPLLSAGGTVTAKKAYEKSGASTLISPEDPEALLKTEIYVQDLVRVLLVLNTQGEEDTAKSVLNDFLNDESMGSLVNVVTDTESMFKVLRNEPADIVIISGSSVISGGEINLTLDNSDDVLTRRILRSMGADKPGWSATPPGSALFYLLVDGDLGRSDDWPIWLDLFYNLGAGSLVAPLTRPVRSGSELPEGFSENIEEFEASSKLSDWTNPDPDWPTWMLRHFLDRFLRRDEAGATKEAGLALRDARRELMNETGNPLGLTIAHYGPANQRLVWVEGEGGA
jgi:hypothetical protein